MRGMCCMERKLGVRAERGCCFNEGIVWDVS